MLAVGLLLGALLDPFFIVPAGIALLLIRAPWPAFLTIAGIAIVETATFAAFLQSASPAGLLALGAMSRITIGGLAVWLIAKLRKPSTP